MNHSPATIIYHLLTEPSAAPCTPPADAGEWPLFIASMPDEPENAVGVFDTAGIKVGRTTHTINKHGFQVMVRALDYDEGWAKAQEIAAMLDVVHRRSVEVDSSNDYVVDNIIQESPILPLGQEPGTRHFLFTMNYMTFIDN